MMPGSVQEVRMRKRVVVVAERKSRIGSAGVTLVHTSPRMKMQKSSRTKKEQPYQQALAPQSFFNGPVTQHPQKN
jgi:hypothetical protein